MQDNLADMLDRAAATGGDPRSADTQAAIALIIGPLHYWLLSAETITPAVIDTLVPMVLRALGTAPSK